MNLEIKKILPKYSYVGEEILIKTKGKSILIYYMTRYANGKPKSKKFQPAKTPVPNPIKISNNLIECMGMYQGDGQKYIKSKSYQSTRFANTEPILVKLFSILTGEMLSPPGVISISFFLSVIFKKPLSKYPMSPVYNQPFLMTLFVSISLFQ